MACTIGIRHPGPLAPRPLLRRAGHAFSYQNEDELFLVIKGRFRMEFRDRHVWLEEGEFLIVPRGVEHRPVAEEEAPVLLFEPASTLNTGNVRNERTVARLDRI